MPQQEQISELISDKVFKDLEKLAEALSKCEQQLVDNLVAANNFNIALGNAKGVKQIMQSSEDAARSIGKVAEAVDKVKAAQDKMTTATERAAERQAAAALRTADAQERAITRQQAASNRAATADYKAFRDSTDQRKQLTLALKDQEVRYANLYLTQGKNAAITLEAKKGVLETRAVLDDLNQSIGRYGDNVGNYSGKFTAYANTLRGLRGPTKLLGEALGIGAQEADQFRIVLEHSFQGIAAFFRGKEEKAAASAAAATATVGETAAETLQTAAQNTNTVATEANTIATEGAAVAETELAVATTGASLAMKIFRGALLVSGIGILIGAIAYGVVKFREYREAVEKAEAAQRLIGETNLKGAQSAQGEIESLNELYRATQNHSLSIAERKKAVDELQKQAPEYFKNIKDETILAGKAANAYEKLKDFILATAKARASEELITENRKRQLSNDEQTSESKRKQLKLQNDLNEANRYANEAGQINSTGANSLGNVVAVSKALAVQRDINAEIKKQNNLKTDTEILNQRNISLEKNIDDLVKKNGVKIIIPKPGQEDKPKKDTTAKDLTTGFNEAIEAEKRKNDQVQQNDQSSFDQRLASTAEFQKKSIDLINQRTVAELKNDKLSIQQKQNIAQKGENDVTAIETEAQKERQAIRQQQFKGLVDSIAKYDGAIEAFEADSINIVKEAGEKRNAETTKESQARIIELQKGYDNQQVTLEQYNKEKQRLESEASQETLANEIATERTLIDIRKEFLALGYGNQKDLIADEKKLNDLEIKLFKEKTDEKSKISNEEKNRRLKVIDEIAKAEQELQKLVVAIVSARFTKEINALEKQSQAVDKNAQVQIDAENRSLDSTQVKADKIAIINAQAAVQKQVIADKERELKNKQAKVEKAANILTAIELGALATLRAFATEGVLSGFLVGIASAAAVATVIATPIPQYFTGTESSKAGPAIVGERGTELVIEPSGKKWLTPEVPTMVNLIGGSKIINNKELMQEIARPPELNNIQVNNNNQLIVEALERNNREVRLMREELKAARTQRRPGIGTTPSQWDAYVKSQLR